MRDKVHSYDITITEVSGIGLRIEMSEELAIGETIRLLVSDYNMYAQVRRCVPSESGFIIGVERIDAWNGPPPESPLIAPKTATASGTKVLGRPRLRKPLDNLHGAALRALFADSRLRTNQKKYQAAFVIAGCLALAGWAGFGAGFSLHGKPKPATAPKAESAKPLPSAPQSAAAVAPPKSAATAVVTPLQTARVEEPPLQKAAVVAPPAQKTIVVAPALQKATVVAPAVQKATVVAPAAQKAAVLVPAVQKVSVAAPSPVAARPAIAAVSRISIKATDVSWLTACVDGAKVLDTLLVKGYVGQIPFAHEATLRFGNAGAIELAVGSQPAAKIGSLGEVRTIRVTSTGYTLITLPSALNCNIH
jgi:hypothetical protein